MSIDSRVTLVLFYSRATLVLFLSCFTCVSQIYFLVTGRVAVCSAITPKMFKVVRKLGPGDHFGLTAYFSPSQKHQELAKAVSADLTWKRAGPKLQMITNVFEQVKVVATELA